MLDELNIGALFNQYVLPWGINIVMALVIFIVGKFFTNVVISLSKKIMVKAKTDGILINFISSIVKSVMMLFVIIASLDQLGVDTTSLVALIGAAGLAIGLSLQSSLQNLAAGVMLIVFRPFRSGDFVEAGGAAGTIEEIGIFTTMMRSGDNREIVIPNAAIFSGTITNYSKRATRRIDLVFGIGYDDDLLKAKEVITKIIESEERILAEPEALVAVGELADSSVNFNVRPWVKTEDYWSVYYALNEKIKLEFDANGISIPYPQMEVHSRA